MDSDGGWSDQSGESRRSFRPSSAHPSGESTRSFRPRSARSDEPSARTSRAVRESTAAGGCRMSAAAKASKEARARGRAPRGARTRLREAVAGTRGVGRQQVGRTRPCAAARRGDAQERRRRWALNRQAQLKPEWRARDTSEPRPYHNQWPVKKYIVPCAPRATSRWRGYAGRGPRC